MGAAPHLDGDLSPRDRDAVEEHLAGCGACAGYVAQVRRMLELTAGPEQVLLDPTIVDDLVSRFNG